MLLTLALVAAACGGSTTQSSTQSSADSDAQSPTSEPTVAPAPPLAVATTAPEPTTEPTPEPTPEPTAEPTPEPAPELELAGIGQYGVGVETVIVNPDSDRPLTVEVWFPVASDTVAEAGRYEFITGDFFESELALAVGSDEIVDGTFPLVVYSHGSGGLRYIHSNYTEFLASHGHVVVAPDHTGNTSVEQFLNIEDDRDVIAFNRPTDVANVIDAFTVAPIEATSGYAAAVDAERIAVTGHSFGGFTSYAAVAGYENPAGAAAADDRIKAIIPLAPAVGGSGPITLLDDDALARVDVPSLIIVGTDDKTTPVDPNVDRAWDLTLSEPHYRVELVAAEHQSFTDVCDYLDAHAEGKQITDPVLQVLKEFGQAGCAPGDMPIERVQELTNTFALAFLQSVFADGEMIAPEALSGTTDVIYDAK